MGGIYAAGKALKKHGELITYLEYRTKPMWKEIQETL